jgi:hypothetical protein
MKFRLSIRKEGSSKKAGLLKKSASVPALHFRATGHEEGEEQAPAKSPKFNLAAAATAAAEAANVSSSPQEQKETAPEDQDDDDCLMFEDDDDDDSHDDPVHFSFERPSARLTREDRSTTPPPPVAGAGFFRPLFEVTIDPHAVPPSPMRDPHISPFHNSNHQASSPADLLTTSVDHYRSSSPAVEKLGAPLGDIGMRTQLWDAQRLVRVILGKPQVSDKLLETGSILLAIRTFAVMKQELIQLRQHQEARDGDPPTILESLGSPATTRNSSTLATPSPIRQPSLRSSFTATPRKSTLTPQKSSVQEDNSINPRVNCKAIVEAAKHIQHLERQLQQATVTIHKLQQQQTQPVEKFMALQQVHLLGQRRLAQFKVEQEELQQQLDGANEKCEMVQGQYEELFQQHQSLHQESKRDLDSVVMQLASVPTSKVPPEEAQAIRNKLQTYVQTISKHSSHAQVAELQEAVSSLQKTSSQQNQELQDKLEQQESELQGYRSSKKDLPTTQEDVENILLKLNSIPAKTVPPEERQQIRKYVVDLLGRMAPSQTSKLIEETQEKLTSTQERERCATETLRLQDTELAETKQQVEDLQRQLTEQAANYQTRIQKVRTSSSTPSEFFQAHLAEMEHQFAVADPHDMINDDSKKEQRSLRRDLEQAELELDQKNSMIIELEEAQSRLQTSVARVMDTLGKQDNDSTSVLKELQYRNLYDKKTTTSTKPQSATTSQRLQSLHEEHQALVATIQVLEEEMKLGT